MSQQSVDDFVGKVIVATFLVSGSLVAAAWLGYRIGSLIYGLLP